MSAWYRYTHTVAHAYIRTVTHTHPNWYAGIQSNEARAHLHIYVRACPHASVCLTVSGARLKGSTVSFSKCCVIMALSTTFPDGSRTGSLIIVSRMGSRNSPGTYTHRTPTIKHPAYPSVRAHTHTQFPSSGEGATYCVKRKSAYMHASDVDGKEGRTCCDT